MHFGPFPLIPINAAAVACGHIDRKMGELDMSSAVIPGRRSREAVEREVLIGALQLPGNLTLPAGAGALVLFAHGSSSSRQSPRNRAVARALNEQGMATLLFDLLNLDEEQDRTNVFDIALLADRLIAAVQWIDGQPELARLPLGLFGASTGAAAALVAAARLGGRVGAVVLRGGRPDLAAGALEQVTAPTLLIVGGLDDVVIELNEQAYARLRVEKALEIVPDATHLFPEPGALERVMALAADWFSTHLIERQSRRSR